MDKIFLDPWEWRLVEILAQARIDVAKKHGYSQKNNKLTFSKIDKMGKAGERAFYKMLDRYYPVSQSRSEIGKPDIVVHGATVEIKTTDKMTNNLMVEVDSKTPMRDLYVLMIKQEPFVYYVGYIRAKSLFLPDRIVTIHNTQFYKAYQKELFTGKFWELESREFPIIPKSGNLQKVAEVG